VKSKAFLLFILAILAVGSHFYNQQDFSSPLQQADFKIQYDYSVKTVPGQPIKVARAIDGDTIELINGERMRYVGIDTPEEFDQRKPVQCYALEAANRNHQLVDGKDIVFYPDVSIKDKYGRWLGFIYLPDGTFVNEGLVAEGLAFSYPYKPDTSKKAELQQVEDEAHSQNLGLWSHCTVTKLKGGRKQTNAIQ
jgi:micrococcal nuclease